MRYRAIINPIGPAPFDIKRKAYQHFKKPANVVVYLVRWVDQPTGRINTFYFKYRNRKFSVPPSAFIPKYGVGDHLCFQWNKKFRCVGVVSGILTNWQGKYGIAYVLKAKELKDPVIVHEARVLGCFSFLKYITIRKFLKICSKYSVKELRYNAWLNNDENKAKGGKFLMMALGGATIECHKNEAAQKLRPNVNLSKLLPPHHWLRKKQEQERAIIREANTIINGG
jgi:hypothetical protein